MRGLHKFKRGLATKAKRLSRPSRRRLRFQTLEERRLLAGDMSLSDGVLHIVGSDNDDSVDLFAAGDQIVVSMAEYGADGAVTHADTRSFDQTDVRRICFQGKTGDDVFANDTEIPAVAVGGAGDDVMIGGPARNVLYGGAGGDLLLGDHDRLLGGSGDNAILTMEKADPQPIKEPMVPDLIQTVSVYTPKVDVDAQLIVDVDFSGEKEPIVESDGVDVESVADVEPVSIVATHMGVTMTNSLTLLADETTGWDAPSVSGTVVATFGSESIPADPPMETADAPDPGPCEPFVEEEANGWAACVVEDIDVPPVRVSVETECHWVQCTTETEDTGTVVTVETTEVVDPVVSYDDVLVGGVGRDLIFGGLGDDLLIGDQLDDDLLDSLLAHYLRTDVAA